jgi:cobalamin biosynthesis protein CobD/CbiB
MNDYSNTRDQILNGIVTAFWLLSLPFVWIFKLIKWFVISVTKETGNKIVKVTGSLMALAIISFIFNYFK